MPPTWKTIAATWLSRGHPGPHCFHMGCRQHSLLAIKIAEDKRQTASTSWQILICKQAFLICTPPPLKTRASVSEKFNEGIFFGGWGLTFILEKSIDIDLTLLWWKHYKLEYNFPTRLNVPGTFFHIFETNNSILLDWVYYDYSSSSCHILEGCKCTACLHLIETFTVLSNTVGKKLRPPDWPSIDMPLQIKKALRWLKTLCYRGLM